MLYLLRYVYILQRRLPFVVPYYRLAVIRLLNVSNSFLRDCYDSIVDLRTYLRMLHVHGENEAAMESNEYYSLSKYTKL